MKALKRQAAYRVGETAVGWHERAIGHDEPIDELLEHNVALVLAAIETRVRCGRGLPSSVEGAQLELPSR